MSIAFYPLPSGGAGGTGTDRSGLNWSYEQGLSTWTPDSACWQVAYPTNPATQTYPYHAAAYATFDAFKTHASTGVMTNDDLFSAAPASVWSATVRVIPQPAQNGQVWGRIGLKFLNAGGAVIQTSPGSQVITPQGSGTNQVWQLSTVTATAPALTANVKIYVEAYNSDTIGYTGRVCFDWCTLHG